MTVFHDSSKCELGYDPDSRIRPCRGAVREVAGIKLCAHHRKLLDEIVRDANQARARRPVRHKGVAAA